MCRQLADDPSVGAILESPPRWDAPLRLLGGLHNLVLRGKASWDDVGGTLEQHSDFLRRFVAVDVTTDEGALLLRSFVWADKRERLDRLDQAIEALRQDPPELVRGDFVELVPAYLDRRRDDALMVVMQIASAGYVDEEGRRRLRAAYTAAGEDGPLALVSTGPPADGSDYFYGLWITLWPGGESELVAHADFHGAWLEWLS